LLPIELDKRAYRFFPKSIYLSIQSNNKRQPLIKKEPDFISMVKSNMMIMKRKNSKSFMPTVCKRKSTTILIILMSKKSFFSSSETSTNLKKLSKQ